MAMADFVKQVKGLFSGVGTTYDYDTLVAVINQSLPAGQTALITKQENLGQLVSFTAHLSQDLTDEQLQAILDAVAAHPAITGQLSLPFQVADQDCDGLTPDATITSMPSGVAGQSALPLLLTTPFGIPNNADFEWQAASAAESVGGSGSALRLTDLKTAVNYGADHAIAGQIVINSASHGLAKWTGFEVEFDFTLGNGGDSASNQQRGLGMFGDSAGISAGVGQVPWLAGGTKWFVGGTYSNVDSGITVTPGTYHTYKIVVHPYGLTAGATAEVWQYLDGTEMMHEQNVGTLWGGSMDPIRLYFLNQNAGSMGAVLQRPMLIDNFRFIFLSGELA